MASQNHLAVSANTTQVFSPEHRGTCTAYRCEPNTSAFLSKGKHPFPPSLRHKEPVSDKDADTALDRALQNECASRLCVAERHTAVRSARWSLTPAAAGEFAASFIQEERQTQGNHYVPKPPPESINEECQDQDRRRCQRHAQPFLRVSARLVHTSEFLPVEMGGGHHLVPLYSIARAHAVVVLDKN